MREALRRAASNRWDEMTPEQAVEEVSPVLRAGAEAVAESLATGKPLKDTRLAVPLEQAFLAESPDASEEAQARCRAIREAFAEELEMAVKADAAAQAQKLIFEELSEVDTRPVLRVEVRGTAGRSLIDRAVAVGSKPECDVQVFGDEGVRPLQFLVVSLSTCTVIADFSGETCATWRSSMRQHEHNGLGVPGATFMIAPGEESSCKWVTVVWRLDHLHRIPKLGRKLLEPLARPSARISQLRVPRSALSPRLQALPVDLSSWMSPLRSLTSTPCAQTRTHQLAVINAAGIVYRYRRMLLKSQLEGYGGVSVFVNSPSGHFGVM